jgi:hypothetical protein
LSPVSLHLLPMSFCPTRQRSRGQGSFQRAHAKLLFQIQALRYLVIRLYRETDVCTLE